MEAKTWGGERGRDVRTCSQKERGTSADYTRGVKASVENRDLNVDVIEVNLEEFLRRVGKKDTSKTMFDVSKREPDGEVDGTRFGGHSEDEQQLRLS